jgi:hypothetical protein
MRKYPYSTKLSYNTILLYSHYTTTTYTTINIVLNHFNMHVPIWNNNNNNDNNNKNKNKNNNNNDNDNNIIIIYNIYNYNIHDI